jgi:hypothetical protein
VTLLLQELIHIVNVTFTNSKQKPSIRLRPFLQCYRGEFGQTRGDTVLDMKSRDRLSREERKKSKETAFLSLYVYDPQFYFFLGGNGYTNNVLSKWNMPLHFTFV